MKVVLEGVEGAGKSGTAKQSQYHGFVYVHWDYHNYDKQEFRRMLTSTQKDVIMDRGELSNIVYDFALGRVDLNLDDFELRLKDYVDFCAKEGILTRILTCQKNHEVGKEYEQFTPPPKHATEYSTVAYMFLQKIWDVVRELYENFYFLIAVDSLSLKSKKKIRRSNKVLWNLLALYINQFKKYKRV